MAIKFVVILNGKELIAVTRGNLIQELSEIADVALLVGLEVGGDENDAFIGKSVVTLALLPEADVETDTLLVDEHIEAYHVALKRN